MSYKPFSFMRRLSPCLLVLVVTFGVLSSCGAQISSRRAGGAGKITIVQASQTITAEVTAAKELQHYLSKMTGQQCQIVREGQAVNPSGPVFYVGPTQFARKHIKNAAFADEEWLLQTQGKALILTGSRPHGTLYAVYHYLEDVAGVHWWNPWEETVPSRSAPPLPQLNKRGRPAFRYRDIFCSYAYDNGRFAIRNRLNRDGDMPIGVEYGGGSRNYGPPDHVHTLYGILSPEKYYKEHPDWFIVPEGKEPTHENSQLHLSHPQMRREFLKLLRENIRRTQLEAKAKGVPAPQVFSVSQMDNGNTFAGPGDTELLARNGGARSAVLLDFINYLADGIKDEFPGVFIDTLAYGGSEKVPVTIRPRDNVVIRLTDTTSNQILPITDRRNHFFRSQIQAWSKITKNLRVWDYGVTYTYPGLPMPTTHTYPTDFQFWKASGVKGVFMEHEYPILSDMRDLKFWLQTKLMEDPGRDYHALVRQFTDGFYGPAGTAVRRYIYALHNEAERVGKEKGYEEITWFVAAKQYNYLSLDFLIRANAMFDEAAKAAGADGVLQRRVRHARMPLDRFITLFNKELAGEWAKRGQAPAAMPLDTETVAMRYYKAWNEQIDLRLPDNQRGPERSRASAEIKRLTGLRTTPLPARFREIPAERVSLYEPGSMRNFNNFARVVPDALAENGVTSRLEIPDADLEKYKLPMPWGVRYKDGQGVLGQITPGDIPTAGYHWHKLGDVTLSGEDYVYFFWSWYIQLDLNDAFDAAKPAQQFEVWANLKFEGPAFPHGKAEDKNAISVERVVLVKKEN